MYLRYLLPLCLALGLVSAFNPDDYENSLVLREGIYTIHWTIEDEYIYLGLQVQTTGWLGFGLAEPTSGSMPGADMITAIVKDDGEVVIEDRHATMKDTPFVDECSNWELINGEESNGETIIEVRRQLDTGDSQDRVIESGVTRIVWAYGNQDVVQYHESNRQATTVVFFGEGPAQVPTSPDIQFWVFTNDNYTIPPVETTYYNNIFPIDELDEDVHIVALEAILPEETRAHVHHFLAYGCEDVTGENCTAIWGWAPGVDPMITPPEAGFRAGPSEGSYKALKTQTHFDNPDEIVGMLDNSGIRVHYTANLRQYDASVILIGDPAVTTYNPILQGQGKQSYEYNCPEECTSLWEHPIHVFSEMLHMHQAGASSWNTHWRDGEMLGQVNRIEFYDFNFQQNIPMSSRNYTIYPGDRINLHCVYHRSPNRDIPFGMSSREEMCINFVNYYPKLPGLVSSRAHRCGFIGLENKEGNFNVTYCLDTVLVHEGSPMPNPTALDPPGGEEIQFGKQPEDSYECPQFPEDSAASPSFIASVFSVCALVFVTFALDWMN